MQYQVFIQSQSEEHFVASVVGMTNLTVEGRTEEEAISKVKSSLEAISIKVNLKSPNIIYYVGWVEERKPTYDVLMFTL